MAPEAMRAEMMAALARWGVPMAPEAMRAEMMALLAMWVEPACFEMKPPVTES